MHDATVEFNIFINTLGTYFFKNMHLSIYLEMDLNNSQILSQNKINQDA